MKSSWLLSDKSRQLISQDKTLRKTMSVQPPLD